MQLIDFQNTAELSDGGRLWTVRPALGETPPLPPAILEPFQVLVCGFPALDVGVWLPHLRGSGVAPETGIWARVTPMGRCARRSSAFPERYLVGARAAVEALVAAGPETGWKRAAGLGGSAELALPVTDRF